MVATGESQLDDTLTAGEERGVRPVLPGPSLPYKSLPGTLPYSCNSLPSCLRAAAWQRVQKYTGDIHNNVRHGVGTYEYANKFFRYEGEYVNGKKHGV